jgi:hypothetical protein
LDTAAARYGLDAALSGKIPRALAHTSYYITADAQAAMDAVVDQVQSGRQAALPAQQPLDPPPVECRMPSTMSNVQVTPREGTSMVRPPLTVHNAEITTARVEIKTLTVSGKQVTLAVFRQLRRVPILPDDGVLAGDPWGTVNYHPDKCADVAPHWHVVWQHGTDLLRSAVSVAPPEGLFWPDEADRFITSCIYDLAAHGSTRFFNGEPPVEALIKPRSSYADPGITTSKEAPFVVRMALSEPGHAVAAALLRLTELRSVEQARADGEELPPWYQSQLQRAEETLAEKVAALGEEILEYGTSTEDLFTAYKASIAGELARRARHAAARNHIAALPQLFIAV